VLLVVRPPVLRPHLAALLNVASNERRLAALKGAAGATPTLQRHRVAPASVELAGVSGKGGPPPPAAGTGRKAKREAKKRAKADAAAALRDDDDVDAAAAGFRADLSDAR
jgi:hypothetical protein